MRRRLSNHVLACALLAVLIVSPAHASDTTLTPSSATSDFEPYPCHRLLTSGMIGFYQRVISPGLGTGCQMEPHCSEFARLAFLERSPLQAFAMSSDRLLRCGRDLHRYQSIDCKGATRYRDPVTEASFALFEARRSTAPPDSFSTTTYPRARPASQDSLLLQFASQLEDEDDYLRAITEYRRLVCYFPLSPLRPQAEQAALRCYLAAEQYAEAIAFGRGLLAARSDTEDDDIHAYLGIAALRTADYAMAHKSFDLLAEGGGAWRQRAVMAQGLTFAQQRRWDEAALKFESLAEDAEYSDRASANANLCRRGAALNYRKPALAGVLGIIPGLGYVYDGYYETGVTALVLNGLFMWGAYEAFENDHPGLGVTLILLEMGWYTGNIYGSISSAKRRNTQMRYDISVQIDVGFSL